MNGAGRTLLPGLIDAKFGLAIPTITGPEQAQAFVDARIAEGSDFIKIVMESGYGFPSLDLATAKG